MVRVLNKPIGILGGSFDPAHKGHLIISKLAIKKLKLNKVLWLVTKQNPFKKENVTNRKLYIRYEGISPTKNNEVVDNPTSIGTIISLRTKYNLII